MSSESCSYANICVTILLVKCAQVRFLVLPGDSKSEAVISELMLRMRQE